MYSQTVYNVYRPVFIIYILMVPLILRLWLLRFVSKHRRGLLAMRACVVLCGLINRWVGRLFGDSFTAGKMRLSSTLSAWGKKA